MSTHVRWVRDKRLHGKLTFALRVSHPSSDFSSCNTDHAQTLGLAIRSNLFLCLSEGHAILEFPKLGCSVCFFSLSCPINAKQSGREPSHSGRGGGENVLTFAHLFASLALR